MAIVLGITNQKGGVGKTTTAVNLAACLGASLRKTLLIDMDPQGNATSGVGIDKNLLKHTIYDVLLTEISASNAILKTPFDNLSVLPSNIQLIGAEVELVSTPFREQRLRLAIHDIAESFDYIVVDSPPSLGLLTINVLTAVHKVIIPVQCEYYALEGLSLLMETIQRVNQKFNPRLRLGGILMTMSNQRTNLSQQVIDEVKNYFGDVVFRTVIPRSVRLSEAPSFGKPIIFYDLRCIGSASYVSLCQEIIELNEPVSARAQEQQIEQASDHSSEIINDIAPESGEEQ
jgi:chromosome partitioning protein